MTPEERQMLSGLFDRVRAASNGPRDAEAEAFINDAMRASPSAAYVLTQSVLVQQQALEAASRHIAELEAQASAQPPATQESGSFLGNIGRSLFGGGAAPPAPRPYDPGPAYQQPSRGYAPPPPPPPPQGGPWGGGPQGGPWASPPQPGGFLHGALQTATGVAGGMLLGNAIGGLFGGHGGGLFGGGAGGGAAGGLGAPTEVVRETVNNYYGGGPGSGDDGFAPGGDDSFASGGDDSFASGGDDFSGGGGGDDWA
jgi:uncharacterized protein